jgi:hypothetical protein
MADTATETATTENTEVEGVQLPENWEEMDINGKLGLRASYLSCIETLDEGIKENVDAREQELAEARKVLGFDQPSEKKSASRGKPGPKPGSTRKSSGSSSGASADGRSKGGINKMGTVQEVISDLFEKRGEPVSLGEIRQELHRRHDEDEFPPQVIANNLTGLTKSGRVERTGKPRDYSYAPGEE